MDNYSLWNKLGNSRLRDWKLLISKCLSSIKKAFYPNLKPLLKWIRCISMYLYLRDYSDCLFTKCLFQVLILDKLLFFLLWQHFLRHNQMRTIFIELHIWRLHQRKPKSQWNGFKRKKHKCSFRVSTNLSIPVTLINYISNITNLFKNKIKQQVWH